MDMCSDFQKKKISVNYLLTHFPIVSTINSNMFHIANNYLIPIADSLLPGGDLCDVKQ